ncbi:unnamed protein product [Spirodela intermedia]|uniref:Protein kinase domain-containing protein n=1 Tax=Spirodela intermedia TaxID=51605 RepID=A0ABN7ECH6_SPIIN|nr:unnamed protein product [Spirodela intermedia]
MTLTTASGQMDLSSSNLDGPIPTSIGNLTVLVTFHWIPQNLCEKKFKDALSIYGDTKQCESLKSNKRKKIIITIIIVASIISTMLFAISVFLIKRKRKAYTYEDNAWKSAGRDDNAWKRESVQFTHSDIIQITQNFQYQIGKGGFGTVYLGNLNDGTNVAVKVLSSSSLQGSKEFEAESASQNLVCLLGYCADSRHLSLVYEYMDNKTLKITCQDMISMADILILGIHDASLLNWNQRVNIALQSAQGLDYLHNGCQPPIIHRDIKSSNILLNRELVAKLADFGLSRTFNTDSATHITTRFGGTPGYLAPE